LFRGNSLCSELHHTLFVLELHHTLFRNSLCSWYWNLFLLSIKKIVIKNIWAEETKLVVGTWSREGCVVWSTFCRNETSWSVVNRSILWLQKPQLFHVIFFFLHTCLKKYLLHILFSSNIRHCILSSKS
jgi:hypothetical protein